MTYNANRFLFNGQLKQSIRIRWDQCDSEILKRKTLNNFINGIQWYQIKHKETHYTTKRYNYKRHICENGYFRNRIHKSTIDFAQTSFE
jgi:hypothetical protein